MDDRAARATDPWLGRATSRRPRSRLPSRTRPVAASQAALHPVAAVEATAHPGKEAHEDGARPPSRPSPPPTTGMVRGGMRAHPHEPCRPHSFSQARTPEPPRGASWTQCSFEPPYTEPYVRWCERTAPAGAPPTRCLSENWSRGRGPPVRNPPGMLNITKIQRHQTHGSLDPPGDVGLMVAEAPGGGDWQNFETFNVSLFCKMRKIPPKSDVSRPFDRGRAARVPPLRAPGMAQSDVHGARSLGTGKGNRAGK